MKHLFVVNPVAGKQKPEEKLRLINEAIDRLPAEQRSRDEFEIYVTEAPMDACRHIRGTARTERSCASMPAAETAPSTSA